MGIGLFYLSSKKSLSAVLEKTAGYVSPRLCQRPRVGLPKTKHPVIPKCSAYHPAGIAQVCNLDLDLVCILGLQGVHQEVGSTKWC